MIIKYEVTFIKVPLYRMGSPMPYNDWTESGAQPNLCSVQMQVALFDSVY